MPAESQVATLAVGQRVGKYLITEKLGEGGMGLVLAGVHEALGREVAVKVLRGEFARNEQVIHRFQQEAESVSRIGHANIVAVYDFGRLPDGSVYYVMERIRGETLTQRVNREPPMSPPEIVAVFSQICRALHATHTRNIVHRDLKPDNILLQPQKSGIPHVKIVDFGVAKMRELAQGGDAEPGGGQNMTKQGMLLGTPTYMAPEQITSSLTVDARADLYSLGAILYEVLTGQPPFGRGELMVILTKHVREIPTPPSQKQPRIPVPPAVDAMILKALAKKPGDRQADANAFISELETAFGVGGARSATGQQTVVQPNVPFSLGGAGAAKARARWPIAVAAGVVVLGGGGAAPYLLRKPPAVVLPAAPVESASRVEANKVLATALAGDARDRKLAVEAMGEVGDHGALDQVVTALGDDNPEIRRAAASAAIAIGRPEDTALKSALADAAGRSGGAVAVDIAAARYHVGDVAAEEDLKRALELRDPGARLRAAVALADGGKLPAGLLRQAIAAAPPTVRRSLRWAAYVRLDKLGDPAFQRELQAALKGADPVARLDAAQTLARASNPDGMIALAGLAAEAPDPIDRVDAAAVQAELGDVGALDALGAALKSPSAKVRARAATSLGRLAPSLPDQAALEKQLTPLLQEREPEPRIAAAAALLAVKAPAAPPAPAKR